MNGWYGLAGLATITGLAVWLGRKQAKQKEIRHGEWNACPGCGAGVDDHHDGDCPRRPW